ncbi:hypothetical protein PFLUV_G00135020 [Perca fluviatilis]|uniref:Uncharacterized protein n=1 Tax=Perca fluviatilis TaxID=8168 RepID=A0A6A5F589_PERFL|nr:hypothetical protein PFLUV_G00135020 [Perca fluviatilis]
MLCIPFVQMMWVGVLHHVRNEHSWATGFCEHEPLEEGNEDKPWINQGSAAHQALTAIVLDKRTTDLESFQNHLLMYAAKRMPYTPFVYKTRTLLGAIDKHNQRLPARNREGHKMYRPRHSEGHSVQEAEKWDWPSPQDFT